MSRLNQLRINFIKDRVDRVNPFLLEKELMMLTEEQLDKLAVCFASNLKLDNSVNSSIVYSLGLSDIYNPTKEVKMSGGSPPDI